MKILSRLLCGWGIYRLSNEDSGYVIVGGVGVAGAALAGSVWVG